MDITKDGRCVAIIGLNRYLYIYKIDIEKEIIIEDSESNLSSVQFSKDGQMLAVGGWDKIVRIYDT